MKYALQTRELVKDFGGLRATNQVTLNVAAGARHALIGPNGAGKTTLINLLTGFLRSTSGSVALHGEDITAHSEHARARRGLVRTFQVNQLFPDLTVFESVVMAINERQGLGYHFWKPTTSFRRISEEAMTLLTSIKLADVANREVRHLAYGKQRLVEIALALATKPRVLLLDEPAAGVPAAESRELFQTIAELPGEMTILLIEHDMNLVFNFADRITVLVNGAVLTEGSPQSIASDSAVKEVYLGESAHV